MNMSGDHHFPEPIIQHIQSFLTPKKAARTAILSKSWRDAWITRPNLEFIQSDFPRRWGRRYEPDLFSEFANKTLKRYEDSNRAIESITISVEEFNHEFIARALKIGATRLIIECQNSGKELPCEVVFGSENLVSLSVEGCAISLLKGAVVRCSRLRSLCLDSVCVRSTGTITRILSSCPLIERLSLSNIYDSNYDNYHYYHDDDDDDDDDDDEEEEVVEDDNDDGVLNGLHRLRSLVLNSVYCDKLFLWDISTRFPSLKDLTVVLSSGIGAGDMLLISSSSIERLDITIGEKGPRPRIKFDVPNIRKFIYHGPVFPSCSFRSTSREWESHVYITRKKRLSASWLLRLSRFLTKLRRSRIHISLCVSHGLSFNYKPGEIRFWPALEIKNLTIDFEGLRSLSCYALLDALFRMCSPKLITRSASSLVRALLEGVNVERLTPNQFMYGLNDLKEAKAQVFDEAVSTWRDVPLDALSSEDSRKLRFQLDWATVV